MLATLVMPGAIRGASALQAGQQGEMQPPQSGIASSGPQKAQFDSQHRPITAGTSEKRLLLEAKGPGVCLLDYDKDGWLDIYLVNGSTYDALAGKATPLHSALFRNNHDGTFTEVTQKAGVANDRWGYGCAVGDYDNDGWPDLYVTNYGKNRLYHNNHDGTFTDAGDKTGVT